MLPFSKFEDLTLHKHMLVTALSAWGMNLKVNLAGLGAPAGSGTLVRMSSFTRAINHVMVNLPEPESQSTLDALARLHQELAFVGIKRAWFGSATLNHPTIASFQRIGFELAATWQRHERNLKNDPVKTPMSQFDFALKPLDATPEQITQFFDDSRSGREGLDINLDRDMSLAMTLHEIYTAYRSGYSNIYHKGELIGIVSVVLYPRMNAAIVYPLMRKSSWESDEGLQFLNFMCARMQEQGVERLGGVSTEESQAERIEFLKRAGFHQAGSYVHFIKNLV